MEYYLDFRFLEGFQDGSNIGLSDFDQIVNGVLAEMVAMFMGQQDSAVRGSEPPLQLLHQASDLCRAGP